MSKGTVKSTPKGTQLPGTISVTDAGINSFRVTKGVTLSFDGAAFNVNVGDTVEVEITSSSTCNVLKVVQTPM